MRTYRLTVAYDGTKYQGWQKQKNTELTIQAFLEKALREESGCDVVVNGSGRTDAGVHARGQTVSVVLPGIVQEGFFTERVNERLPEDIRIVGERLEKNGFHARKSATGKKYQYFVDTGEKQDVFTRKFSFHYPCRLDLDAMRKAASYLTGTHDYAGYTDKKDDKSTKRTIYAIIIGVEGPGIKLEFDGTGFLYHMVRILTGTLLEVGAGLRTPESARTALKEKDRALAGFLAPAKGLFLYEVRYNSGQQDKGGIA